MTSSTGLNSNNLRSSSSNFRRPPIRQPLSCVPCRRAKIKCDRRQPCASCRRRSCLESCGYGNESERHTAEGSLDTSSRARLQYLESLVRQGRLGDSDSSSNSATYSISESEHSALSVATAQITARCFDTPGIPESGQSSAAHSSGTGCSIRPIPAGHTMEFESSVDENVASYLREISREGFIGYSSVNSDTARFGTDESNSLIVSDTVADFPFGSVGSNDDKTLLMLLPPKKTCDYLVSRYFTTFSPLFHVLHSPTFRAEYQAFSKAPRSAEPSWLSLLFVILALSITCLEDHDPVLSDLGRESSPSMNIKVLASRYREAAMKSLMVGQFLVHFDVNTLQALILLIYAINHSQGSGQSWSLLGIALHASIALGFHRDDQESGFSVLELQQRRRCWAGLLMLYTVQAITFGVTDTMRLDGYQVSLPADVNDSDIHPDRLDAPTSHPTEMTYMLFKFRMYKLSSNISRKISATETLSPDVVAGLDQEIRAEEANWDCQYLLDGGPNLFNYRDQAHWNILHSYANQLYLLIHRPFVHADPGISSQYPNARPRCIAAGLAILNVHKEFCNFPGFQQYRWFTSGLCSFFALHGAVTLAVLVMMMMKDGGDNFGEVFRCRAALDEVIDRFRNLQQQSVMCARALPILIRLQSFIVSQELNAQQKLSLPFSNAQQNNTQCDAVFGNFFREWSQPDHWTGPGAINWKLWDTAFSGSQC